MGTFLVFGTTIGPIIITLHHVIFCQRTAKGAGGKGPRQKSSQSVKNISTLFDNFRAGQKKRQKIVKIIFDTFRQFSRGTNFPAPFGELRFELITSDVMYFASIMVCEEVPWQCNSGRRMPRCLPRA